MMTNLNDIVKTLQNHQKELEKEFHLSTIGVFGSYVRNEQTEDSDIDILVDFSEPIGIQFIDLANTLEKILDHQVDLVSKNGIKQSYLELIESEIQYV